MFPHVLSSLDLILIMEVVKRIIASIVPPHNKTTETRLWSLHSAKTAQWETAGARTIFRIFTIEEKIVVWTKKVIHVCGLFSFISVLDEERRLLITLQEKEVIRVSRGWTLLTWEYRENHKRYLGPVASPDPVFWKASKVRETWRTWVISALVLKCENSQIILFLKKVQCQIEFIFGDYFIIDNCIFIGAKGKKTLEWMGES